MSEDSGTKLPDNIDLVHGEKPKWTDPTTCPYPDCDTRTGELRMEYHLSNDHGWFMIGTDFDSEPLAEERNIDDGEQVSLGDAT